MLNVKYYKDYRHNYLILKCSEEQQTDTYQRKMLAANPMKGLLKCQERHVNGEMLLYYEITSRQSLASIYEGRSMGLEVIQQFFLGLKLVNDTLQKYLLDDRGLVLSPEYIFRDLETEEFFFLYYPENHEENLSRLMEFFMDKVDNENAEAVETVYRIADLIHREQLVLDEILEWLNDTIDDNYCEKRQEETRITEKEISIAEPEWAEAEKQCQNPEEKNNYSFVFLIAGLLGMGILFYIMNSYRLNDMGKLLLAAGWSMVVFLLAGATFGYIRQLSGSKMGSSEGEIKKISYERTYPEEYELQREPATEQGNTVFIPWTENCENRLYGMNKGNKYHIDLGHLPLTVGKLAGAVDMVIDEQGISRMHARFTRAGAKVCITDLNSTNGTFKNGLRLQPNDSEIIEPGDEIRLGKLKFIYR